MGFLRFLLALSVVIAHTVPIAGLTLVGGPSAVQIFFMISGFYMSLVLDTKYISGGRTSLTLFYSNRALRIFPPYLIIVFTTLAFIILFRFLGNIPIQFSNLAQYSSQLSPGSLIFLSFVNLAILGQDLVMFLGVHPETGSLFFTSNFWKTSPPLHSFLLVPQAWSISLELMFYLIVPWLVRWKNKVLLLIIAVSLLLRWIVYSQGFNHDPWSYRFFPLEITFFLGGILAHRLYQKYQSSISKRMAWRGTLLFLVSTVYFQFFPRMEGYRQVIYLFLGWLLLPLIFHATRHNKIDRAIGELSYPIYITHMLVIVVLEFFYPGRNAQQIPHSGSIVVIISIVVSILLQVLIAKPLDTWRQKRLIWKTSP